MERILAYCSVLPALLLIVGPLWGQRQAPSPAPSQPGTAFPGASTRQPGISQMPSPSTNQSQGPLYVNGRILMESGQPASESVSVELNCGMRPLQVIHTDLGGFFTFSIGAGAQSNMDFSASNESPMSPGGSRNIPGASGSSLTGCEVRVSVPGFHPLAYTLADHADMGRVEVGTLRLRRIAGVEGSAISVTSLLVPNSARKEYEKAEKDLRGNHVDSARQHLEKAIAEYDKYAAAWNELGHIYLSGKETEKARGAFEKAIAADAQYIPPYLSLAALHLQSQQYEKAVETAGKALELDPSIGYASFIQAVGNFNLNRLDAAEKGAREAEKGPHENMAQLHALLADIYVQKQDYTNAATQMRAYLKESPQGQFAGQMRKDLEQIEKSFVNAAKSELPTDPQ